jgi:hypothetical protein
MKGTSARIVAGLRAFPQSLAMRSQIIGDGVRERLKLFISSNKLSRKVVYSLFKLDVQPENSLAFFRSVKSRVAWKPD